MLRSPRLDSETGPDVVTPTSPQPDSNVSNVPLDQNKTAASTGVGKNRPQRFRKPPVRSSSSDELLASLSFSSPKFGNLLENMSFISSNSSPLSSSSCQRLKSTLSQWCFFLSLVKAGQKEKDATPRHADACPFKALLRAIIRGAPDNGSSAIHMSAVDNQARASTLVLSGSNSGKRKYITGLKWTVNFMRFKRSTLAVASSSTRMRLARRIARARHTSCRCPNEKFDPPSDTLKSSDGTAAFKST
ncbi:hypothetical protein HW555_004147 [Spodoptera exigua]|uniref:Uncharacterized protein n=1 Tax=Spodoptera exigua TaxID=7107 RepID=A0A835LCH6_SPOEX|nr:hypothetical protein HW555_004147 [Spodoptera exigua]